MYVAGVCNTHAPYAYGRGVYKLSSCACMDIIIVPSCTMFDRANSNVKLASSSRVESSTGALESSTSTGALEYEYERSSARVRGVRSSSEARVRVLECSSFTH